LPAAAADPSSPTGRRREREHFAPGARPHRDAVGDRVREERLHRLVVEGEVGEALALGIAFEQAWRSRERHARLAMPLARAVSSVPVGAFTQRIESSRASCTLSISGNMIPSAARSRARFTSTASVVATRRPCPRSPRSSRARWLKGSRNNNVYESAGLSYLLKSCEIYGRTASVATLDAERSRLRVLKHGWTSALSDAQNTSARQMHALHLC